MAMATIRDYKLRYLCKRPNPILIQRTTIYLLIGVFILMSGVVQPRQWVAPSLVVHNIDRSISFCPQRSLALPDGVSPRGLRLWAVTPTPDVIQ